MVGGKKRTTADAVEAAAAASERAERIVSTSRAAALLGRDRGTLKAWIDKGCPIEKTGAAGEPTLVDLKRVVEWLEERARIDERKKYATPAEDDSPFGEKLSPGDLLKLENLKLTRLKVGQAAEILVVRSIPEMAQERAYGILRQSVMALPERLTREMAGFPEDKKLAWREKAQGWCREALKQSAKAVADVMGEVPTSVDDAP